MFEGMNLVLFILNGCFLAGFVLIRQSKFLQGNVARYVALGALFAGMFLTDYIMILNIGGGEHKESKVVQVVEEKEESRIGVLASAIPFHEELKSVSPDAARNIEDALVSLSPELQQDTVYDAYPVVFYAEISSRIMSASDFFVILFFDVHYDNFVQNVKDNTDVCVADAIFFDIYDSYFNLDADQKKKALSAIAGILTSRKGRQISSAEINQIEMTQKKCHKKALNRLSLDNQAIVGQSIDTERATDLEKDAMCALYLSLYEEINALPKSARVIMYKAVLLNNYMKRLQKVAQRNE